MARGIIVFGSPGSGTTTLGRAVAAQLWELGIRHFATATLDEAVQLREAGIQGEILILGYSAPAYFHLLAEHGLTQTATCPDHAAQLETYCRENGVRLKVHIAVDTGMHRIGFPPAGGDLQKRGGVPPGPGRGAGDGSPSEQLCGGELPGVRL